MSNSLRDRLAELMKTVDFTAAPKPPKPIVYAPIPLPSDLRARLDDRRDKEAEPFLPWVDVEVVPRRSLPVSGTCAHQWAVRDDQRTCWVCGEDGGRVEGAPPVPDFDARKDMARVSAERKGHKLKPWVARPNDSAGRENAWCARCNAMVVVARQAEGLSVPLVYGSALVKGCHE